MMKRFCICQFNKVANMSDWTDAKTHGSHAKTNHLVWPEYALLLALLATFNRKNSILLYYVADVNKHFTV